MFGVVKYLPNGATHYSKAVIIKGVSYAKKSSSQLKRVRPLASIGSGISLKWQRGEEEEEWGGGRQ
jgi:hypothetical protein